MGRPVGPTRPPLPIASAERVKFIEKRLVDLGIAQTEPHGW
jgi:4-hydroxy-tetrahydrodipicolinate synthase